MTIADIQNREDLLLVTDETEVHEIIQSVGRNLQNDLSFQGIFVAQKDGEYTEIFGFTGTVPDLKKELIKIL